MEQCIVQEKPQVASGADLSQALRRLRRGAAACNICSQSFDCPQRLAFDRQIASAIDEANREWGLATGMRTNSTDGNVDPTL